MIGGPEVAARISNEIERSTALAHYCRAEIIQFRLFCGFLAGGLLTSFQSTYHSGPTVGRHREGIRRALSIYWLVSGAPLGSGPVTRSAADALRALRRAHDIASNRKGRGDVPVA